jgi:demethylspheroidene O-methyltransferase
MAGIRSLSDRLLANGRFQRRVARIPLLRRIGRHHAGALFDLCAGFVYSQVLYASVRSGLLQALREGPLPLASIGARCALPLERAVLLIQATDALGLTEQRHGQARGLGLLGAALLGNPAVLTMIEHQPLFYADLNDPLALLQGTAPPGRLAGYWAYTGRSAPVADAAPVGGSAPAVSAGEAVRGYTELMSATQPLVNEDLLAAYPFGRHRVLLDVGGGNGTFLRAAAQRLPRLRFMLFDLPAVAQLAAVQLDAAGLGARAAVFGGDFGSAALPAGADVVTLIRVVHDHDDGAVRALLAAVRRALPAGGRVVIAEPMRAVPGSLPAAEIYLGFYLLAMGQGRVRSVPELERLLREAGFSGPRVHATPRPWQCAVLSASAA